VRFCDFYGIFGRAESVLRKVEPKKTKKDDDFEGEEYEENKNVCLLCDFCMNFVLFRDFCGIFVIFLLDELKAL
jgi:hypothetical protein